LLFVACTDVNDGNVAVVSRWDTIAIIGKEDPNDTTFTRPYRVFNWGEGLAVIDAEEPFIRFVDKTSRIVWTTGRQGAGPGEFSGEVPGASIDEDGLLRIIDPGNKKLVDFTSKGSIQCETSLASLGVAGDAVIRVGDRIIITTARVDKAVVELDANSLQQLSFKALPWAEPLARGTIVTRHNTRGSKSDEWYSAFFIGPGFFRYDGENVDFHRYSDSVPFRNVRPREEGDSARFAAHWLRAVNGEVFILFGGRPGSRLQEHEFPRNIDVYTADGVHRRTLKLPIWSVGFDTNGEEFFVVQNDPYPAILIIKPART
jgi:hypothetical protein